MTDPSVYTHDLPPGDVEALLTRLAACDGKTHDAAFITWEQCQALVAEVRRLRAALRDITDMWVVGECDDWVGIAARMSSRAEEALEAKP